VLRYIVIFFLLLRTTSGAQQLVLTLSGDTINFSETVRVTLNGELKDINNFATLPDIDGLVVTETTNDYNYNQVTGKVVLRQSFTLQPIKPGKYSVGPAWVMSGNKRVFSNKATVVVNPNKDASQGTVFMRCEPKCKKVFIGQQIELAIRVYHRIDIRLGSDRPFARTFNGFWYQQGPLDETYGDTVITAKGLKYVGETIYKEYVFPNSSGKLVIPSYEYMCYIKHNPHPTGDPFIDEMMAVDMPVQLYSDPVPIEVVTLPQDGKPDSFLGDVGKFTLSATVDSSSIRANESITLTVKIIGSGNIKFMQAPKMNVPSHMDVQVISGTDSTDNHFGKISGMKEFKYIITPHKEGQDSIPTVQFSYYDVQQSKYITLSTPSIPLLVKPGKIEDQIEQNNLSGFLNQSTSGNGFLVIIFGITILGIIIAGFIYYRKNKVGAKSDEHELSPIAETTLKIKPNIKVDSLTDAYHHFQNGNMSETLRCAQEALREKMTTRFGIGRNENSRLVMLTKMSAAGLNEADAKALIELQNAIGEMRFTGLYPEQQQVKNILGVIERL
jgi:hypothetical protein